MHILFITRHYPPEVSGGARRPWLLVKYMRRAGHRVTLVNPFAENTHEDDLYIPHPVSHIGKSTSTNHITDKQSYIRNFFRQWLLWPDPEIRWYKRVYKHLVGEKIKPDIIITTSPPESAHIIGARLARRLEIPWLAEFRDTWIINPHRNILKKSFLRRLVEKQMARQTLRHATAICSVSDYVMDEIKNYCSKDVPKLVIGHFSENIKSKLIELDKTSFNLVHTGGFSLSDHRRQLKLLLDCLQQISSVRKDLHLHLAGRLSCEEQKLCRKKRNYKITFHGEISLNEARQLQVSADGLILYTPNNSHALPGKYAEYCFSGRPILVFGGGDWLSLAKDRDLLLDLNKDLANLQKSVTVSYNHKLSAENASKELILFLQDILAGRLM